MQPLVLLGLSLSLELTQTNIRIIIVLTHTHTHTHTDTHTHTHRHTRTLSKQARWEHSVGCRPFTLFLSISSPLTVVYHISLPSSFPSVLFPLSFPLSFLRLERPRRAFASYFLPDLRVYPPLSGLFFKHAKHEQSAAAEASVLFSLRALSELRSDLGSGLLLLGGSLTGKKKSI